MLLSEGNTGSDFEPLSAGQHKVRCCYVVDVGTQPSNNPQYPDRRKLFIGFEVPGETIEINKDGETKEVPRWISESFTASLHPKGKLRPFLIGWRGKDFTPEEAKGFSAKNLVNQAAMVQVLHNQSADGTKTYANISTIMRIDDGDVPALIADPIYYDLDEHGADIPEAIPDWIVNKIKGSHEWSAKYGSAPAPEQPAAAPEPEAALPF